ncbi:Sentrin-specific protease 5 [Frankliniella fusca]|uniref:Sentrin-specific protease 5 n=1 Tax=Frankliniella fusca TaxID=407009 RepID=A0AAE1HYQ1_9NEOP|nr:Sentrin-specific protease 5 [Frankliniella fusca]
MSLRLLIHAAARHASLSAQTLHAKCSCPDFSPLCKHIRRVHMLQLDGRLPVANEQTHHAPLENPLFNTIENYAPENVVGSNCEHELDDKSESVKFVGANENLHANESSACVDVASVRRINIIRETLKCLDLDLERSPGNRHLKKKPKHQSKLKRPNKQSVMEIKQFFVGNEENSDPDEPPENDFTESLKDCKEDSEENFLSVAENKIDVIVYHGWGLPVTYCTDSNDIILICNGIKLSLLHLKSLEENLSTQEVQILKRADEKFQCGWLYSDTINAFIKSLETNNTIASKDVLLFPANLDGNHWVLPAVIVSKEVIYYNNSLIAQPETPLNSLERELIESVATTMRSSYPSKSQWNVKRHFGEQRDFSSCGVFVCWVAYQLATNEKIDMLPDPASFRKAIYRILSLNC